MDIEDVARILYDTCRSYHATIYDWEQRSWEKLFDHEKENIIKEVRFFLEDANRSVEAYHNAWIKRMIMSGWSYNKTYDHAAKEHHNLRPFKELLVEYQFRDHLFKAAIDILNSMGVKITGIEESENG